jgi:phage NTP-binding protein
MQISYSRVECYKNCPYQYKLKYLDGLTTIKNQDANNALYLGSGIHLGIEKGLQVGINEYLNNYYVVTDLNINEIIKYEYLIPKIRDLLPDGQYEVLIENEDFKGFIDLLTNDSIYDFKYSNNIDKYLESPQLHLYKYFYEQQSGKKINNLYYIMIPKIMIKQKKTEDLFNFRKRLQKELNNSEIQIVKVDYDENKVIEFLINVKRMLEDNSFNENTSYLCNWCEFEKFCLNKGEDYMLLPKNVRRERVIDTNPDMWIYADSYVGKSTFIDKIDNLLFINTDGNTDNTTSPVIRIIDDVTQTGRLVNRRLAWDSFLDVVTELEKRDNEFKAVAIDLVEDLYEHCRLYMYDKLGIEHEQDAGFGKGWDMVKTEFLSTIKRLKNVGCQIIYISKEVTTELNLKNGGKLTTIKPNINDKVANVLAGTVDLTIRAYLDGDERKLLLEKRENIFGGGRFNFKTAVIDLEMSEFKKALIDAQEGIAKKVDDEKLNEFIPDQINEKDEKGEELISESEKEEVVEDKEEVKEENTSEQPKRRTRRTRTE